MRKLTQRQNSLLYISREYTGCAESPEETPGQRHTGGCVLRQTDIFLSTVEGTMDVKCTNLRPRPG